MLLYRMNLFAEREGQRSRIRHEGKSNAAAAILSDEFNSRGRDAMQLLPLRFGRAAAQI